MGKSVISILMMFLSLAANAQSMGAGSEFKEYAHRLDLLFQTRYYQSNGNFKSSGNSYDSLPSGYAYTDLNFDFAARMPLSSTWAGFASTSIGYAQAKSPATTHTNSAFSNAILGTDFLMSSGQMSLIPEFSLLIPFKKVDYSSDVAAVDDGVMQATARLIGLVKTGTLRLGGYAGYDARMDGLASLYLYGILAEFDWKAVDLGFDLRGYGTLGSDKDNDTNVDRNAYFCNAEGCSKRFNGVNPALLESNAWLRWKINPSFDFTGGLGFAITGQNTSTGYSALAGLMYHWGANREAFSAPVNPGVRPVRPQNPQFQEETNDGVDQTLFNTSTPSTETVLPAPKKVPTVQKNPDAQRKKLRQKMQDDLNKTEMQIELKSTKKKKPPVVNDEY